MENPNDCKVTIGHDFNNSHNDEPTVLVSLITAKEIKIIAHIHGRDSEGILDLTSILLEHGYKIVKQN